MRNLRIRSASEQLADFLKEEIRRRTWTGKMPGESWLVTRLQVGRDTVRRAMAHLEEEGVLLARGKGQRRQIVINEGGYAKDYRVTILLNGPRDCQDEVVRETMFHLTRRGYHVDLAPKSLIELKMNVERVAKMARQVITDVWVVSAGSKDVIEWFSAQAAPAFAMFGSFSQRSMAGIGPDKFPAYQAAVRRLVELGHRSIVLLLPEFTRKPNHGIMARRILEELERHGITTGPYHLPDWEHGPAGLRGCLDRLFDLTPPTALFVEEAFEFVTVQQHLARRGIFAPENVSLICSDDHSLFEWCDPSVSCIRWSTRPVVNRIVRWVDNVAGGRDDRRKSFFKAEFIEGGTIGPVPKRRVSNGTRPVPGTPWRA